MVEYLARVVDGIEKLARQEIKDLGLETTSVEKGSVIFQGKEEDMYRANYLLKTVERIIMILNNQKLDEIKNIELERKHKRCRDFALVIDAKNPHMKRKEIREILMDKVKVGREKEKCEERYYAYVVNDKILFGLDTTGESLKRRGYEMYKHPSALNSTVAAAMSRMANSKTILDPFCGSGTVPIENNHIWGQMPNKFREFQFFKMPEFNKEAWLVIKRRYGDKRITWKNYGIDIKREHVKGAIMNAKRAKANIMCTEGHGENVKDYPQELKTIVTNPPYGLRVGTKKQVFKLYEKFAKNLEEHFSGGTLVIITPHPKLENYFTLSEKLKVRIGKLEANIYKFKI